MIDYDEILEKIKNILDKIIKDNSDSFKENDSLEVRPGYGYDKFYLDWVDGDYDMSLQGLIHHIMYEEGIYKAILNDKQYQDLELLIEECPENIYGLDMDDDDFGEIQCEILDCIYADLIEFVGNRLIGLGFDVEDTFAEYLD
jgi:hypothetical protein